MKVYNLTEGSKIYTSNVFFVLGDWNAIEDVNTLIDVGSDEDIFSKIEQINTGLGKKKVDQVILTHSHSDHTAILHKVISLYSPKVYAFNSHIKGADYTLHDEDIIRIGDKLFEVFHITAHSYDSVCLYCEEVGVLFAGDTTFPLEFENMKMEADNAKALSRLSKKKINKVYYGHGEAHDYTKRLFSVKKEKHNTMH